jgi:hypothetical protein
MKSMFTVIMDNANMCRFNDQKRLKAAGYMAAYCIFALCTGSITTLRFIFCVPFPTLVVIKRSAC